MKKKIFIGSHAFTIAILTLVLMVNCKQNSTVNYSNIRKNNFENYLKNTTWLIENNKIIGQNSNDSHYNLTLKVDSIQIWNFQAITFIDSIHFKSYDSWECGNDCFTATFGRYVFVEKDKINIYCDSLTRSGTCAAPTEYWKNPKPEEFAIAKTKSNIVLTKLK